MKTAEEIFMEVQDIECPNVNNLTLPEDWKLKAMQVYANKKLDEAAKKAKHMYIEINGHLGSSVIEESVLSFKDKI